MNQAWHSKDYVTTLKNASVAVSVQRLKVPLDQSLSGTKKTHN
jgi:hypothetical protein